MGGIPPEEAGIIVVACPLVRQFYLQYYWHRVARFPLRRLAYIVAPRKTRSPGVHRVSMIRV